VATQYRTPAYVARVLCRAQRPVTVRTLLNWADKGLLPRLIDKGKGQGKGKVYFWHEPDIVRRAYTVRELLSWSSRTETTAFMLWLLGYNVDVARWVRPRFAFMLDVPTDLVDFRSLIVNADEEQVGESLSDDAYEEMLNRLSELAVEAVARWRHDPRRQPNRALILDPRTVEMFFNVLTNPHYEPSVELLSQLISEYPSQLGRRSRPGDAREQAEYAEFVQQCLSFMARTLSVPRQHAAVVHATDEDWRQVQQDFQRVLRTLTRLVHRSHSLGREVPDIGMFKYNVVLLLGAHFVVPIVLALGRAGYGHWIERASTFLDRMDEQLASGSFE